uniref:Uncharacterized protein n=1 Tax=Cacopsylla melanoneura TaxID=428564 RepID=A0A8D8YR54_9HEMI
MAEQLQELCGSAAQVLRGRDDQSPQTKKVSEQQATVLSQEWQRVTRPRRNGAAAAHDGGGRTAETSGCGPQGGQTARYPRSGVPEQAETPCGYQWSFTRAGQRPLPPLAQCDDVTTG